MNANERKIFVFGATGNVGSELMQQFYEYSDKRTRIVGIANSKNVLMDPMGIPLERAAELSRDRGAFTENSDSYQSLQDLIQEVATQFGAETIFIDATAEKSELMRDTHKLILDSRGRIITANKNPISIYTMADFQTLTNDHSRYHFGPTVGAGAGFIDYLYEAKELQEEILSIEGCFSGTLGYLCSQLDDGILLSEAVRNAKKNGYTEPNPWEDLNGLDVARKLLILARTAGFDTELYQIEVEPFVPEKYEKSKDLIADLKDEDEAFTKRIQTAKKKGLVLRYVAELKNQDGKITMKVSLKEVEQSSNLGGLRGTANLVKVISSQRAPAEVPHIIQSAGAGIQRTAAAIRRGVNRLAA
jgi:aspartokinase/homoserine dehydrogenase 1